MTGQFAHLSGVFDVDLIALGEGEAETDEVLGTAEGRNEGVDNHTDDPNKGGEPESGLGVCSSV